MDQSRIAKLLEPFIADANDQQLTADDLHDISTYIDILLRWNARINLTAIRDPEQIVTRHFGESLFAARHLFPDRGEAYALRRSRTAADNLRPATGDLPSIGDVGSGAGFPGIPIKLWAPGISLTLIESNHKKATFLREVTRALTLTDINIQNVRAETLPPASFDLVTLRAVERFDTILPTAAALVKPSGRLSLLIGTSQLAQAIESIPQYHWRDPIPVPSSRQRILVVAHRPA